MTEHAYIAKDAVLRVSLIDPEQWLLSWGEGSARVNLEIADPRLAGAIAGLPDMATSDEVEETLRCACENSDVASEITRYLFRHGFYQSESNLATPGEEAWERLDWRDALVFHRATRNMQWRHEYPPNPRVMTWYNYDEEVVAEEDPPTLDFPNVDGRVELGEPLDSALDGADIETLWSRRTIRNFRSAQLTLDQLSSLLHWTFRPIIEGPMRKYHTTLSSADGWRIRHEIYPINVYVLFNADKAPPQIIDPKKVYQYNPERHSLDPCSVSSLSATGRFGELLWDQEFADGAPVVLVLAANWKQMMWKYRLSIGYRMMHFDLGAFMQTALIVATALGLRTFITPALDDDRFLDLIGITEGEISPAYILAVGSRWPGDETVDPAILEP